MNKLVSIFCILLLLGCNSDELDFDNIDVPNLNGEYVFPVGDVTYRLDSLIEDLEDSSLTLFVDPETNLLSFFYQDSVSYGSSDEFVNIENFIERDTINNITDIDLVSTIDTTITRNDIRTFDYNPDEDEEDLDSVFYAQGTLIFSVNPSNFGAATLSSYTITFENIFDTNNQTLQLTGSGENNVQTSSLQGHKIILNVGSENTFNANIEYTVNIPANETFTTDSEIALSLEFIEQEFDLIYGDFGQDTVNVDSLIFELDFFTSIESDGFFFANPIIRMDFENDYGLPIAVDLSDVFGDNGEGSVPTFLTGDVVNNPEIIEAAPSPTEKTLDTIQIDRTNSNIVQLLANAPSRIVFDIDAISNPIINSTSNNFLGSEDSILAKINIQIPLEVELEDVDVTDTLEVSDELDISDVESAYLRIATLNGLPLSGLLSTEIVLRDTVDNNPYLAGEQLVLEAASVDRTTGLVTSPSSTFADIPIEQEGIVKLEQGAHIIFTVLLNSSGSGGSSEVFVKLLANYELNIDVGIGGKVDIDL